MKQHKTESNRHNNYIDKSGIKNLLSITKYGRRAIGLENIKNMLAGVFNHRAGVIKAKCYDCSAGYADGIMDCSVTSCPLYPYHHTGIYLNEKQEKI